MRRGVAFGWSELLGMIRPMMGYYYRQGNMASPRACNPNIESEYTKSVRWKNEQAESRTELDSQL